MPKCKPVKNPCEMCMETVTQKNGMQCSGACKSWLHYGCLNYTPGRIKDIKTGIIKINCPCPDCTSMPPSYREYRTDVGYRCPLKDCPANKSQKCDNKSCPTWKGPDPCGKKSKCANLANSQTYSSSKSECSSSGDMSNQNCSTKESKTGAFSNEIMEKMLKQVGQLTNEINELVVTMNKVMGQKGGGGGGSGVGGCAGVGSHGRSQDCMSGRNQKHQRN